MVNRAVAITGMAWSTALGDDLDAVWNRLVAGESGVRAVASPHRLRNYLAAPVAGVPAASCQRGRQVALTAATIRRALNDAALAPAAAQPWVVAGTSYGSHMDEPTGELASWITDATTELGLSKPPIPVSTACSAGSDALGIGAQLVAAGAADVCVSGGTDVLTAAKRLGHTALGTMSPTRLRAFDSRRDGMLLGEGAAYCVLESMESARRRGARVHAVVRGVGASNDAAGVSSPDTTGEGVMSAIRRALASAGVDASDVAVINAHGTATPANDDVEMAVLTKMFGEFAPVVFATKGAFGHTLGATGAIEAVALVMALRHRKAPPIHGLARPHPDVSAPMPVRDAMPVRPGVGLSVTLGFGGFNTCLVFASEDCHVA